MARIKTEETTAALKWSWKRQKGVEFREQRKGELAPKRTSSLKTIRGWVAWHMCGAQYCLIQHTITGTGEMAQRVRAPALQV